MLCRLSIVAVLLVAAAPLAAQGGRPNTREGFWFGAGGGWASAGTECSGCSTDRLSGFGGYARAGATVSPSVLIGGEVAGWTRTQSDVVDNLGFASVVALIYPGREGGFFLKVGLGGMTYRATDGADELTAQAPGAMLGAGYEFRVSRNVSIVPYLNSLTSSAVEFEINGVPVPSGNVRITLYQLGVGVAWH